MNDPLTVWTCDIEDRVSALEKQVKELNRLAVFAVVVFILIVIVI